VPKYVITPRRGGWWIDAVYQSGKRTPIRRYNWEREALRDLGQRNEAEEAKDARLMERDLSRFALRRGPGIVTSS
jgi:hypothetical protein